jgi:uncharacterized protein
MSMEPATRVGEAGTTVRRTHGTGWTLAMHLVPGVLFLGAFIPLALSMAALGLHPSLGAFAADVVVLVPVLVGVMWWAGRHAGGWRSVIGYRESLPPRRFLALGAAALAWAIVVFTVVDPLLAGPLREGVFGWVPDWFDLGRGAESAGQTDRAQLVGTWLAGLIVGSLLVPVTEELYFRGFLLPRLESLGWLAPVVSTVLFAVYHFAQPWLIPTRILATFPLFWMVWRTRSVYLGIAVHVALNLVGDSLLTIPTAFG